MYHIVFCANENYIKFAASMIRNIIVKTAGGGFKQKSYCFHILSDGVSQNSKEKLSLLQEKLNTIYPLEILIHEKDDKEFQGTFKFKGNYLSNYRLYFADFVPQDTQNVLYLDIDMFVCADLRELFEIDLKDNVAGVVNHLGLARKYFNSGFMLFNLKEWKKQDCEKKCIEFIQNTQSILPDQDALNFVLKDKVLYLEQVYNFFPHNANLPKTFLVMKITIRKHLLRVSNTMKC